MRVRLFAFLFASFGLALHGQTQPALLISLAPGASIPLGENASWFTFGASGEVTAGLEHLIPAVSPRLTVGYDYVALRSLGGVHLFHAGGGLALPIAATPALSVSPYLLGGYTYGFLSDNSGSGGGPFVKGGATIGLALSPHFAIGLDLSYTWDIGAWSGLALSLFSGASIPLSRPAPAQRAVKGVDLLSARVSPVFPAMFKLYDSQPFGTATFANLEKTAVSDVTIDFLVASYMDNPTRLLSIPRLEGGEKVEVPLRALFSEQVLKITEATKVSGKLSISFVLDGKPYSREFTQTVALNNRNNIAWDDTRKAATFVTPNDPLVLTLAKSSVAATADMSIGQVDPWLADAMAIHEALRAKGQRYSIDPNTPFDQISRNAEVLDTVYFPQETLAYGAGDCDDLSVLFNALLQSVGAQTAFITIPGHIYAAVKLDVSPNRVSKAYSRPQDFIIRDGSVWLPVEITMTASRFADAWQTGAQEWREYSAKGQAELLPVLSSWSVYEPVGQIPPLATAVNLPAPAAIAAGYRGEMSRFIDQEIARRAEPLRKEIADRKSDPRPVNSLGVVYAEYGRIDLATPQFEAASAMNDYLPALINLAGVRFISRDYATALSLYRRAKDRATSNPSVLLGLARSLAALEQYDEAGVYYRTLQDVSPDLASQFAYLAEQGTGAVRAAGQESQRSRMVWDEEGQ